MRINLIVPYSEHELAKKRGAKWDISKKTWYVENPPRLDVFIQWIPEKLLRPTQDKPIKKPQFKVVQPRTPRKKR